MPKSRNIEYVTPKVAESDNLVSVDLNLFVYLLMTLTSRLFSKELKVGSEAPACEGVGGECRMCGIMSDIDVAS